ncbi:NAD(P)-dependent alcohol dehydrogenase [Ectothiorhodospiraceae bacterium WFHF3C12]|nr:NAD(P)-dependent alcohol dehydrogenase [Ectothiorhodospiraceae bacterium WFHF3C12]
MKAVGYQRFGGPEVLAWTDGWPEPRPGADGVIVAVRAGGLNPKDALLRKGKFRRTLAREPLPRVSGMEVAGTVIEAGPESGDIPGEAVFGMTNAFCGGLHAEKAFLRKGEFARMPPGMDFDEAAALPLAGQTALQGLRDYGGAGDASRVLINGASGGVGHFAVQTAKALGAHVTAVCSHRNLEFVRGYGADEVIDYGETNVTALPGPYDCVFDVFGQYSARDFRACLARHGRYVSTVPKAATLFGELLARTGLSRRSRLVNVRSRRADLEQLARWYTEGRLRAHVENRYPMTRAAEAHRQIETKRTRGKIVLTFDQ